MKTRAQYHEKNRKLTTTMYDFAEALNAAIKQVYPENQG